MKKSILPCAIALLLFPQLLISQDSMDITYDLPIKADKEVILDTEQVARTISNIATLQSFELIEGNENEVNVAASFLQKTNFELIIYNDKGLNIYTEPFETDELNLVMGFSNLPAGKYFVKLKTKDGEAIHPFK